MELKTKIAECWTAREMFAEVYEEAYRHAVYRGYYYDFKHIAKKFIALLDAIGHTIDFAYQHQDQTLIDMVENFYEGQYDSYFDNFEKESVETRLKKLREWPQEPFFPVVPTTHPSRSHY